MIIDMQVQLGDGDADALLAGAKAAGLDGVVLTGDAAFASTADLGELVEKHGVAVFSGAQIATNHGLILALLPDPTAELGDDWADRTDDGDFDAEAVIDAIEDLGGVTVALRPYDRDVAKPMGDQIFGLQGLAACDVKNGRVTSNANGLALEAASNLEMPCIGSSSADDVAGLGTAATLFRGPIGSEAELVEAIRHGECWPISFSTEAPPADRRPPRGDDDRRGGGGGGGGRSRRGRRGGERDRGDRDRGERDRGERDRGERDRGGSRDRGERGGSRGRRSRRGGRSGGGGGGGDDRGNRARRGGGGGGGGGDDRGNRTSGRRRGPVSDDAGNRKFTRSERHVDEDIGNIKRPERIENLPREDIGNRVKPDAGYDWDPSDDNIGNR